MYPNPDDLSVAIITPEKQQLIGDTVMKQCEVLDGLEDGILNNPLLCDFNVESLICKGVVSDNCLSQQEIAAAKTIYDDFYINGKLVFPGYPVGGELSPNGWARWLTGGESINEQGEFQAGVNLPEDIAIPSAPNAHFSFGNGVMKYLVFHDPNWDYSQYSFDTFFDDVSYVSQTLDATEPDLDAFRARGGKLLITNSWTDMAISSYGTIAYYNSVIKRDPNAAEDVKLTIFPGVDHCWGGAGPYFVDFIDVIDNWVDTGKAPDQLIAFWLNDKMQPDGSRPICSYPKYLVYKGSGDPREASSFSCVKSK
jgi:feruloyl esterase